MNILKLTYYKYNNFELCMVVTGVMLVFTPEFSLNILNFAIVNGKVNGDAPPLRYLSFEEKFKGT